MSRDTSAAGTFVREGEYWTVVFDGRVSRVRDAKGMRYLDVLVHHPGEEIPALALVAAVEGNTPAARRAPYDLGPAGNAGPVLDRTAIAAYRRRVAELQEDLDDAQAAGDGERAARARIELEALTDQLTAGLGRGGRPRRSGAPAERARLAVTKAIRSALAKLEKADPALGRHLDRTIRTGTSCAYVADPRAGVRWEQGAPAGSTHPAIPEIDNRTTVPSVLPLVGRDAEVHLVRDTLGAVDAGTGGRLLLLSGEAGIGKSRLVQEATTLAAGLRHTVLVGRCVEADSAVPWGPVVEMVDQLARQHPDESLRRLLGAEASDVARLLPALVHRLPGLGPPAELPPAEARRYLERSVAEVLIRAATAHPVLAVIEDLHWCDSASLAVLERMVDRLAEAPLVLMVTCRPDEPGLDTAPAHTMERLLRSSASVCIRLRPLIATDVAQLATAVGGGPADPLLVKRLSTETGGNPLFVVEMLKHLKEEGRLGDGHEGGGSDAVADLPASLRLVIGHRLRRLSVEAREVLTTAAVVGRDVDDDLLRAIQPCSEDALDDAVDEAIRARLLVPVAGATDTAERLRFVHALVRHAVLAELTPMRRRRVHRAVAAALIGLRGADADAAAEIADHLDAGHGDRAEAARFHQRAARRALERFAYEDAASRLDRALDLAPPDDWAWRASLLADRGAARRSLGQIEEMLADWSEAIALLEAQGPGLSPTVASLCVDLATTVDVIGRLDDAVAFARRGLTVVGTAPTPERSRLLAALGYALALQGEHAEAEDRLTEAAAIADGSDDGSLRGRVLAARTSFEFIRARFPACLRYGLDAFNALVSTGELWHGGQALLTSFIPCAWMGRFDEGLARAEMGTPILRRVGHLAALCWDSRLRYAIDIARTGNLDAFAAATDADVDVCRANQLRWLADAQVLAGMSKFWQGDWDAAAQHLQAAAAMPTPAAYVGRYTASLLCFTAWRGDAEEFDRLIASHRRDVAATGVLDQSLGRMAFALAELEGQAVLGRRDRAAALYPAATDALAGQVVLRPMDLRLVEVLAALAAAAGDDWPVAEQHLRRAREQIVSLPQRREEPDLDRFEALLLTWRARSGDRRRAKALLEQAVRGYRAMGMPRHAELAAAAAER